MVSNPFYGFGAMVYAYGYSPSLRISHLASRKKRNMRRKWSQTMEKGYIRGRHRVYVGLRVAIILLE